MDESKDAINDRPAQQTASVGNSDIDIEKLAEKVYQLMQAEIRLSRARENKHRK